MKTKTFNLNIIKKYILILSLGSLTTLTISPTKAFVPYVYKPNPKTLINTSVSIGRTAAQLLQLGQPKEAARLAELAVRIHKNDERLWSILAEAQMRNKELQKAKESLKIAKQLNPKEARLWFAEASIALQEKAPKSAVYLLNEGLKLEPENASAYFHLGNARIMQNKLNLAMIAFERASELKPTFWEAINNQGIVLFELGRTKDAIKTWRKVLLIKENAEPMLALAAAINSQENRNSEAVELAAEALAKNPDYVLGEYQAKQLWGNKLQAAAESLLSAPELEEAVVRALANSNR